MTVAGSSTGAALNETATSWPAPSGYGGTDRYSQAVEPSEKGFTQLPSASA